jgi:isopenicillin N synthase-like dioxygenase
MAYVPVIDLSRDPKLVGAQLDDVCRHVGFFQVVGHGVPDEVADRAWQATIDFFDLPLEDRLATGAPAPGYPYGYIPFSGESLARSLGEPTKPDLKVQHRAGGCSDLDDVRSRRRVGVAAQPVACSTARVSFRVVRILSGAARPRHAAYADVCAGARASV